MAKVSTSVSTQLNVIQADRKGLVAKQYRCLKNFMKFMEALLIAIHRIKTCTEMEIQIIDIIISLAAPDTQGQGSGENLNSKNLECLQRQWDFAKSFKQNRCHLTIALTVLLVQH